MAVAVAVAAIVATGTAGAQRPAQRPADRGTPRVVDDVAALLARADTLYDAGEADAAASAYAAVLERDPARSRALFRLATLRGARSAESIALLRRYVSLEPRDAWGWTALGDALARARRVDEALMQYASAERLAPAEADVLFGRARLLARAGRTDDAIAAYERALAVHERDAAGWRELAALRERAGRTGGAIDALERAQAIAPEGRSAARLGRLRAAAAPAVEPRATSSRDSDGNEASRAGAVAWLGAGDALRIGAEGTWRRANGGLGAAVQGEEGMLRALWRPRAAWRVELAAGAARYGSTDTLLSTRIVRTTVPGTGGGATGGGKGNGKGRGNSGSTAPTVITTTVVDTTVAAGRATLPVGRLRAQWRAPSGAMSLDLRAARTLLDATPLLVTNGVVREEAGAELDVRLAGPLHARALGRAGAMVSGGERNARTTVGGAIAALLPRGIELSLRGQQLAHAAPSTRGYFAPRWARLAEGAAYAELESSRGVTLALDLGAGVQRVAEFDAEPSAWSPSLRGWAQLTVPLGAARALGLELDAYDSRLGRVAAASTTADSWRSTSASVWVRWAVR